MKWLPWPSKSAARKFQVKVHGVKLRGFRFPDAEHKSLALEMSLQRPRGSRIFSFRRTHQKFRSRVFSKTADSMEWNQEFDAVCSFSDSQTTDPSLRRPVLLSFTVLYGGSGESEAKRAILGKASLSIEESASKMEADIPISLQVAGVATTKATLSVSVSFMELRSGHDSTRLSQNAAPSEHGDGFSRRVKGGFNPNPVGTDESDDSALFDSYDPSAESSPSTESESGSSPGSDTQSDPVPETGFMSWKRRMVSFGPFGPGRTKKGPLIRNNTRGVNDGNNCRRKKKRRGVSWEMTEVESRDGEAKLRAGVVFASFDQCSAEAAGESACAALVAVVAHWLHSNQYLLPTRPQLDDLIMQGSSEWRKLCDNQTYRCCFPNKHFDLETVLKSDIRPLSISLDRSLVGFFSPEKFEPLKGTMSFEKMWNEIGGQSEDEETKVYIVSWNDHFFVLIVEAEACYIIDSLGKRLFEGCRQAYILKFDDSAVMYGKAKKEGAINNQEREIICRGKECCREFIKRFLAAIQVRELEVEEKKKKGVSHVDLHQRLQIDFHFTCLSSSSSSSSSPLPFSSSVSATSSTSSLFSKDELFR